MKGAATLPPIQNQEGDIFTVQLVRFRVTESLSIDSALSPAGDPSKDKTKSTR